MASRLAEQHEVLLLEAGPKHHAWDFRVHMPAALSEVLTNTAYNYGFHTESEAELSNRRLYCCLLYTSPSPRDRTRSRMPSSA